MPALTLTNLSSGYTKTIFESISLKLSTPGFLAIVGKNGSGKTTLLKCIAQQHSYTGSINWEDQPLKDFSVKNRASLIAYFHQHNSISIDIKVKELIAMGRFRFKSILENYNLDDYKLALWWLNKLDISHLAEKSISEISGGEQQLVWICQTFIQDTPVIILDEPGSQLDLMNKKKLFSLLGEYSKKDKLIILVTHDIEYLKMMEGEILNMSSEIPLLEKINDDSLKSHREILEFF